jgi:gliding motility-associated-like protein
VVPIQQNIFAPKVGFSLGTGSITCNTPTIVLTNTSTTGIPPNTFPIISPVQGFLWQGPSPQEPLYLSTTYIAGIQGTYTLTGKDLNNGCFAVATMSIDDFRDYPNIKFANSTASLDCGSPTALTPSVTNMASSLLSYTWTPVFPPTPGSPLDKPTYTVTSPGIYTVTITNTLNGCPTTATTAVVNGSLDAKFEADYPKGYAPHTVNFVNNSSSVSNNSITTVWSFGNGTYSTTISTSLATTMVYTQPGTYSVAIHTTKGSCKDTSMMYIYVDIPSSLEVPNVFTPNGDGNNDVFFLKAKNLTTIYFVVYDRWGHLVYELNSSSGNILWDGKSQTGTDVAEGSYFYVLTAEGKDGTEYKKNGTITVLR